jgi:hypothetical protein
MRGRLTAALVIYCAVATWGCRPKAGARRDATPGPSATPPGSPSAARDAPAPMGPPPRFGATKQVGAAYVPGRGGAGEFVVDYLVPADASREDVLALARYLHQERPTHHIYLWKAPKDERGDNQIGKVYRKLVDAAPGESVATAWVLQYDPKGGLLDGDDETIPLG